ncbi:bifunctional UDP-sugar hydrolase/5'-nucleotidase [Salinactinospora qingdaonensis]|uniref:2',3'-cyclic-nucleotide 2'-phosphodiesterase/5'-or 3'-nucleotidase, 5'-nucleotidase family n=1 Tax=Salinactinospora qingdaonensis TaxID=702744 RepID=A0ABP7FXD8_9ACTN
MSPPAPPMLSGIVATTDVHSHLERAAGLLSLLESERGRSLRVDCGDFFEGTGYYRMGGGGLERRLLANFYDAVVVGNHGYAHHYRDPAVAAVTVCANVVDTAGQPVWQPVRTAMISGRNVAITGIISPQALACVPSHERYGHSAIAPASALRSLMGTCDAQAWVVLSHSGFEFDLALARALPGLDVVFAGHCHSPHSGPRRAGTAVVVKGAELAEGYAHAVPRGATWRATTHAMPAADSVAPTPSARAVLSETEAMRSRASILGALDDPYQDTIVDPPALAAAVASATHHATGQPVLLNATALRPVRLGTELTDWNLLEIDPFANIFVKAELESPLTRYDWRALTAAVGPVAHHPGKPSGQNIVTTAYLAQTHLGARRLAPTGLELGELLTDVLTTRRGRW